uniref:Uncharacterized protein n=1 Tax=viral metagenome TaxID=1070528 RepID=A0A6C0B0Q9_9ZZZZ
METKFKTLLPDITKQIIKEIIELLNYNFTNHNESFYSWFMTNSDYDFVYIYEMAFKRHFLDNFTVETERILSYYSQNLIHAVSSYYDMYRDLTSVNHFINLMVNKQFQYMDHYQLFME